MWLCISDGFVRLFFLELIDIRRLLQQPAFVKS